MTLGVRANSPCLVGGALADRRRAHARRRRADLPHHAQDQYRRVVGAAQRGAHHAVRRQGARAVRQALHRRQHRSVRRRGSRRPRPRRWRRVRRSGPASDVAIGSGMSVQQVWGLAPRMPQAYMVAPDVKKAADLKGKRLSATGGGVGGFNWRMGREVLKSAGLDVERRAVHPLGDGRPAARPRLPARSTACRCIPRTCISPSSRSPRSICSRSSSI